ncbi:CoA transferase [Treponema primitia]|uniref:CaiB/BaiF CoA transferase family protein n=1 Tax=Treponema primitia TaxID=88058 RepID=UPI003980E392
MGLLDGLKVLDLTRVLAGPYCGMMLADMGAEVIKIEEPKKGDDSRANAPQVNGESAYFMNLNRNKKGITLNLKSEKGKEVFIKLVKQSDMVIENYRPGVMEKLGLGYEDLRKINPGIIYGCISGFGHTGPYSKRAGYDIIGQAMSGLMSTTGWPDSPPTRTGTAIADVYAGVSCCSGLLAAYVHKLKTGLGDKVDISLVDGMVSALEIITMIYLSTGRIPTRIGNRYEAIYPYDSFKASDGYVIIACGNDKLYGLLVGLLHLPGMEDECFSSNVKRVENNAALKEILEKWTVTKPIDEIVEMMLNVGIPAAPINTLDRVVKDPHIAGAREMFVEVNHPVAGKIRITNTHLKFSDNPAGVRIPSPTLGQHNGEVLETLGYSPAEIASFKEQGAI